MLSIGPQHSRTEPVKGPDLQFVRAAPDKPLTPLPQFPGGLVCECDRKDFPGRDAFFSDQVGDPVRHNPGFAGPRACHDQERTAGVRYGLTLSFGKTRKQSLCG